MEDVSVKNRLCGVGVITKEQAIELGAVGPVARGSGVVQDMRLAGEGVYDRLGFDLLSKKAATASKMYSKNT